MPDAVRLVIDVTNEAQIDHEAHTAATIVLPDPESLLDPPVVCFGFPGATYSRGYYTFDMPGSSGGGQAGWHVDRGWIFIACDPLGFGEASSPESSGDALLTCDSITRANAATVRHVLVSLEAGTVAEGFPPVRNPLVLGLGQSMGGGLTIILQGRQHTFDGVGILGFSAIHTHIPSRPGSPRTVYPWIPRDSDLRTPVVVNQAQVIRASMDAQSGPSDPATAMRELLGWAFHYDDVPDAIVASDFAMTDPLPEWKSPSIPAVSALLTAPGAVATEAAAIFVPLLLATGERDVVSDPWLEPKAYMSATDITVFVCPQMAHMHNFAGTRELLWRRIQAWGEGVRRTKFAL